MGAGVWAVSVEKSERAIFSQHEKTKQNFNKSSMAAPCVRKLALGFGSGDEQIMPKKITTEKKKKFLPKFSAGSSSSSGSVCSRGRWRKWRSSRRFNCKCVFFELSEKL